MTRITRRGLVGGLAGLGALQAAGALAQAPPLPSSPVALNAFSVFPSAVLLGAPAGPTRVISIAAYQAAFEDYDASLAAAIAMVMGGVQLLVVAAVLGARGLLYRGPAGSGKG